MQVLEILAEKFAKTIKESKMTIAEVVNGELFTCSEYDFSTDTYKAMVDYLNEKGITCNF